MVFVPSYQTTETALDPQDRGLHSQLEAITIGQRRLPKCVILTLENLLSVIKPGFR